MIRSVVVNYNNSNNSKINRLVYLGLQYLTLTILYYFLLLDFKKMWDNEDGSCCCTFPPFPLLTFSYFKLPNSFSSHTCSHHFTRNYHNLVCAHHANLLNNTQTPSTHPTHSPYSEINKSSLKVQIFIFLYNIIDNEHHISPLNTTIYNFIAGVPEVVKTNMTQWINAQAVVDYGFVFRVKYVKSGLYSCHGTDNDYLV